jgi:hypothetical protein
MPYKKRKLAEKDARFEYLKTLFDEAVNRIKFFKGMVQCRSYHWKHTSKECGCVHTYSKRLDVMMQIITDGCPQCLEHDGIIPCCKARSVAGNERLVKLWNNDEDPRNFFNSNNDVYNWKCTNTCEDQPECKHEWSQTIIAMNNRKCDNGCLHCSGHASMPPCCIKTSLAGNSELMQMFDHATNHLEKKDPKKFRCGSQEHFYWLCPNSCAANPLCKHGTQAQARD